MTTHPTELGHALPEPLMASGTADGSTPPRFARSWRARRRSLLDRFDDALCAAAGLPDGHELPEVLDEAGLTFSDWTTCNPPLGIKPRWTGEQQPGHNID